MTDLSVNPLIDTPDLDDDLFGGDEYDRAKNDYFGANNVGYRYTSEFPLIEPPSAAELIALRDVDVNAAGDDLDPNAMLTRYGIIHPAASAVVEWYVSPFQFESFDDEEDWPQHVERGVWASQDDLDYTWCRDGVSLVRLSFQLKGKFDLLPDALDKKRWKDARSRNDAYESVARHVNRLSFFLKDSIKLAALDALVGKTLSNPLTGSVLCVADVAGAPGGFVEYLTFKRAHSAEAKRFDPSCGDPPLLFSGYGISARPGAVLHTWKVGDDMGYREKQLQWDRDENDEAVFSDWAAMCSDKNSGDCDVTRADTLAAFDAGMRARFSLNTDRPSWEYDLDAVGGAHLVLYDPAPNFSSLNDVKQENHQEFYYHALLISGVICALTLTRANGTAIVRAMDCYSDVSVDCIYILSRCFERIAILKPRVSRPANSERYVVCRGFRGRPAKVIAHLQTLLEEARACVDVAYQLNEELRKNPAVEPDVTQRRRSIQCLRSIIPRRRLLEPTPPDTSTVLRVPDAANARAEAHLAPPKIGRSFRDFISERNRELVAGAIRQLQLIDRAYTSSMVAVVPTIAQETLLRACADAWGLTFVEPEDAKAAHHAHSRDSRGRGGRGSFGGRRRMGGRGGQDYGAYESFDDGGGMDRGVRAVVAVGPAPPLPTAAPRRAATARVGAAAVSGSLVAVGVAPRIAAPLPRAPVRGGGAPARGAAGRGVPLAPPRAAVGGATVAAGAGAPVAAAPALAAPAHVDYRHSDDIVEF